jgi:hypothetical protein
MLPLLQFIPQNPGHTGILSFLSLMAAPSDGLPLYNECLHNICLFLLILVLALNFCTTPQPKQFCLWITHS